MSEARTVYQRIDKYLAAGGLFNPESMAHDKVQQLLLDARKALQEAEAQRQQMEQGWQPIATAPKDAGWVLLTDGHGTYFGHRHYTGDWWIQYPAGMGTPTHWMALPAPPVAPKETP